MCCTKLMFTDKTFLVTFLLICVYVSRQPCILFYCKDGECLYSMFMSYVNILFDLLDLCNCI